MVRKIHPRRVLSNAVAGLLAGAVLLPVPGYTQEEVASPLRRYKGYEQSTGYYEEYEARPGRRRPFIGPQEVGRGTFPYSPGGAGVRVRTRLADSHQGIKFYNNLTCEYCHPEKALDVHTTRANLTCRQCHGGEPIASIVHYYGPMNPIRKHAYVCAKCHEGASASFGAYIVHEPVPGSSAARKTFPVLYYVHWFMTILLAGTLAFFIPHSFMVGLRELFKKKKRKDRENDDTD
jgi:hypothetical protein